MKRVNVLEEEVVRVTTASSQLFDIIMAAFDSPGHAYETFKSVGEQYEFEVPIGDTERQTKIED